jgi:hypothetical protein
MLVETTLTMRDLEERYPDPPAELVTPGSRPLIHSGYSYGDIVLCMKAIEEALVIARTRNDRTAIAHLAADQKEARAWQAKHRENREREKQATGTRLSSHTQITERHVGIPSRAALARGDTRW